MHMFKLRNTLSKEDCLKKLEQEDFQRKTVSFYRYVKLDNVRKLRDELYLEWEALGVLGRVYVSQEGINAQISVPEPNWDEFVAKLHGRKAFAGIPFKKGVEEGTSFWKLALKIKEQIVADGLPHDEYDVENVGTHLSAKEWNQAMEDGAIVVDMRNGYESRIGHFKGAVTPDVDTFKEELPMVKEELKGKEDEKVLLYCTGGIRCEKASAYLKSAGFKDVNQLHGGIIDYKHQIDAEGLENKFVGTNYVFDDRTDERISDDVIADCDQCDENWDKYTNCANVMCNLLFIQCGKCEKQFENCCTTECMEIKNMPEEEQRAMRKRQRSSDTAAYRRRIRPSIKGGVNKNGPVFELK